MTPKEARESVKIRCLQCQGVTNHHIVKEHERTEGDSDIWLILTWQIVECAGCGAITFVERSSFSEDQDPNTGELPEKLTLYPARDAHTLPVAQFSNVPPNLRRIYREVMECFNGCAPTVCAAGLRALVEGICVNQNVHDGPVTDKKTGKPTRSKNLEGKIEGMVEKGFLTAQHAQTLHEHRFLGNDAVHELQTPGVDGLKAAISVVEHTLDSMYELPITAKRIRPTAKKRSKP